MPERWMHGKEPPGAQTDVPKNRMGARGFLYAAAPALLYTALSSAVYSLLALLWPMSDIMRQGASMAVCMAYFVWRATKEGYVPVARHTGGIYRYPAAFCYVASVVLCGVACNYLIYFTGLKASSPGYRHVAQAFYGNGLWLEILALCVAGPIAEEFVYRGFVFQRLQRQANGRTTVFLSALLFGVMHLNLVQGIYGFALGLLLAYIVRQTDSLFTAAAAHMASNLTSVLWSETQLLEFLDQEGSRMYAAAGVCALLAGIFVNYGNQMTRRQRKK